MICLTKSILQDILSLDIVSRKKLNVKESYIHSMDLTGWDFSNLNFEWSDFSHVVFSRVIFNGCNLSNTRFEKCILRGADLTNANLRGANMRFCDLTGVHLEGADLYRANLEYAKLEGATSNAKTKFFRLYCPETGPFLGYKKCCNDRLVQLLIPADAKRTSATGNSCRCSKAKVLSVKSFDYSRNFEEAWSLVDPDFVYRVGQWVEVKNFNEDRWMDSTTGIHFWMTWEEARIY